MAGVTPPPQQQQQQQLPTPAAASVMTPEEEFLKRNTDCVYFLASPLTCKKGSECEYRHSDIARMNPRDCWYWLNGNCLNPKCAFRHPPLDGLLGAEIPIHVPPPMPQLQIPAVPASNTPYVTSKQGVPCIFFQKGYCLKGDKCPFLHPPTSGSSKVAQSKAAAPVSEPPVAKSTFGGLEKCTQEQQKVFHPKSVELPPQRRPAARIEVAPTRNGAVVEKNIPPPSILGDELPRYRQRSIPPMNEISSSRSNRAYQAHVTDNDSSLNGKDADEFSREPSPGFDVLVDELRDSNYYPSDEQFGRARGHEGRNVNPMNDYDLGRSSADYNSMADVEPDMYRDPRDYERRQGGHYGLEEQRRSSERMLGGSSRIQRKRDPRDESPEEFVDLRQRISKQRNGGNDLRSVVSREHTHTRDGHAEDRDYRRGPRRESHLAPPSHESSLSSRLRGRIKMPGRSLSPVNLSDTRTERDRDRDVGRHRARLSPVRLNTISSQGRLRDRIKGRVQEEEGRDFRGRIRRDGIINSNIGFSGSKRLSELKSGKDNEGHESQINGLQSSLGKRKYPKVDTLQQSEDELSFEGPKPLSEILKRKRGAEPQVSRSGGYNNEGNKESLIKSTVYDGNRDESNYTSAETKKQVVARKTKETDKEEAEEGLIGDDAIVDEEELENSDHGEAEFDYEQQAEGEDYNLEEGENVEAEEEEEEYLDEDDGDDFAKQMGVELS